MVATHHEIQICNSLLSVSFIFYTKHPKTFEYGVYSATTSSQQPQVNVDHHTYCHGNIIPPADDIIQSRLTHEGHMTGGDMNHLAYLKYSN